MDQIPSLLLASTSQVAGERLVSPLRTRFVFSFPIAQRQDDERQEETAGQNR